MIANFEDFCLFCYVTIDDCYRALPAAVKPRGMASACSDSELLTMAVVAECMGWDAETEAISRWHAYRHLFPHQPDRTRANRRRRALTDAVTLIRQRLLTLLDDALDRQCVIDSLPLPVIGFHLVPGATGAGYWRAHGADYGWIASKKRTIFGYNCICSPHSTG